MPKWYNNWETAAEDSTFNKAVSFPMKIDYHGKVTEVEIIKPLDGDGHFVIAGSGYRLFDRRPTVKEIDAVKRWQKHN